MATIIEQFKNLTRYWWALLILGIAVFIAGILVLSYPGQSYIGLAALFAVIIFISGVVQLIMAFTEKYMIGRGWTAVVGVIELILGIMLMFSPALAASMLPIVLGIWLLMRGMVMIGMASEMTHFKVPGMIWTIILAVLLIICSLMILFHPILVGIAAVVLWVGIALLVGGVSIAVFSFQLLSIKNKVKSGM